MQRIEHVDQFGGISHITPINPSAYQGIQPTGAELCVYEQGDPDSAIVLLGWDEVGMFDREFKRPVYGLFEYSNHYAQITK